MNWTIEMIHQLIGRLVISNEEFKILLLEKEKRIKELEEAYGKLLKENEKVES